MILTRQSDVGRLVRQRRLDAGLTQTELAERAGITRQLLSRFEQGKSDLPLAVALRIMRELNLSIDVRTREERARVVELRLPVMDPTAVAALSTQSLTGLREGLAALRRSVPQFDVHGLSKLQEIAAIAAGSRHALLQAPRPPTRSPENRERARGERPELP